MEITTTRIGNTRIKQATAAAGPGPSTVAAAARKHGRKVPATMSTTSVIELTDSEDDDDDMEKEGRHPPKRSRNTTAVVVSRTPLRYSRAPPPRRLKAVRISGSGRGSDEDKGKASTAVPLFMDDDEDAVGSGGVPLHDNVNDKAGHLPLVPQSDAQRNEEEAGQDAVQIEDAPNVEQAEGPAPPLPLPQQHMENQELEHQQQPTVVGDDQVPPNATEDGTAEDMAMIYIAQILEVLPDVDPDYLTALVLQLHPQHKDNTVNTALTMLFDDIKYPKVDRKGKRKSDAADTQRPAKKAKVEYVDYSRQDRELLIRGQHYFELAVEHLQASFPYVPRAYLRKVMVQHKCLYAPTHVFLVQLYKQHDKAPKERSTLNETFPFLSRKTPYKPIPQEMKDAEFEKEKRWVELYDSVDGDMALVMVRFMEGDDPDKVDEEGDEKGKGKEKVNDEENEDDDEDCPEGEGIECGCCFTEYSFEKMIQCPEAHLFCKSCIKTYASNLLGSHDIRLKCMHQSGCTILFPESELRRVLPQRLIDLYDRLKQKKEIEEADLEGLEECPFCDYKCVIEVDKAQEKLFRCGNFDGGCGAISCRECKRLDHLPKSCKAMDEEKVLNGQHAIEEAMSAALMRSCPNCKKPFIKESGCNKIACYTCGTLSCYVCRKVIKDYSHFDQRSPTAAAAGASTSQSNKCPLWDPVETRHAQEVREAAVKAIADFKAEHPDVDHDVIKVDVPQVPKTPGRPGVQMDANPFVAPGLQLGQVFNPLVAQPAVVPRGRGRRGRGNRRQAQPQPQDVLHHQAVVPPPVQPVQPMNLFMRLGALAQPPMPPAAVALHHHHHPHHHHVPPPAVAMWQNPPPAVVPLPGGFGQAPVPMAAPQAQVFGFHFPPNLNLNPMVQVQPHNLPPRQNPPRRGRYMPANFNVNVNPNPIQVQAQNQPARR